MWTYQRSNEVIANIRKGVWVRYLEHLLLQGGGIDVSFFEGRTERCVRNSVEGHFEQEKSGYERQKGQVGYVRLWQHRAFISQHLGPGGPVKRNCGPHAAGYF
jgi:hypothetical protein